VRLQNVEAIVLRTTPFSETSLVASLFTRQLGRLPVVAKGARRPGKAVAAALQPTNEITCLVYNKPQGGLRTISQVELQKAYPAFASSPVRFGLAARALELIASETPEEETAPRIYFLLREILDVFEGASLADARVSLSSFELQLQTALGYGLQVTACARCGNAVGTRALVISPSSGGVLCPRCRKGGTDLLEVTHEVVSVLHQMMTEPLRVWLHREFSDQTRSCLVTIVAKVWEYHTPSLKRSSTMSFLAEMGEELYSRTR
jgi:DNA repair protein RecO (recombination protein O)